MNAIVSQLDLEVVRIIIVLVVILMEEIDFSTMF